MASKEPSDVVQFGLGENKRNNDSEADTDTDEYVAEHNDKFDAVRKDKTVTSSPDYNEEEIHSEAGKEPEKRKHGQMKTSLEISQDKDLLFVDTRAFRELDDQVKTSHWAVITGVPGDGKTAMAAHLSLKYYRKGYTILKYQFARGFLKWVDGSSGNDKGKKHFILIDDIFGHMNADRSKVNEWCSIIDIMQRVVKEKAGRLKVVCTSRNYIFEDLKAKLAHFSSFQESSIVDLTQDKYTLTRVEKEDIWNKYAENYNVTTEMPECIQKDITSPYGYPHCVEMFLKRPNLQSEGQSFFENPIQYICQEINNFMKNDKIKYFVLLLVLFNNNNLTEHIINKINDNARWLLVLAGAAGVSMPTSASVKKALQGLKNTYISEFESYYSFSHDSIRETVAFMFIKDTPGLAIDSIDFAYLANQTRCYGQDGDDNIHVLKQELNAFLITRMIKEINNIETQSTFSKKLTTAMVCAHQAWDDTTFVEGFIQKLPWDLPERSSWSIWTWYALIGALRNHGRIHAVKQLLEYMDVDFFLMRKQGTSSELGSITTMPWEEEAKLGRITTMPWEEEENYLLCVALFMSNVPKYLRKLVLRHTKPDFQTYLASRHDQIKQMFSKRTIDPHFENVFCPPDGEVNISTWNIPELLLFLIHVLKVNEEESQVRRLRSIRNELVHHKHGSLTTAEYETIYADIELSLRYYKRFVTIDSPLQKRGSQPLDKDLSKGQPTTWETELTDWYENDTQFIGQALKTGARYIGADLEVAVKSSLVQAEPTFASYTEEENSDSDFDGKSIYRQVDKYFSGPKAVLDPMHVRSYINKKGKDSKEVNALMQWLCTDAGETFTNAESVWVGYDFTMYYEHVLTFVIIVKDTEASPDTTNRFYTFEVLKRYAGEVSEEAAYVAEMERKRNLAFSEDERLVVQDCLARHAYDLIMKHSNLLIISASKLKSTHWRGLYDNNIREETCIVLYVQVKGIIPFGEEPFPDELDGFPIDVRESMFENYTKPYLNSILAGCEFQTDYDTYGTLGGFVQLGNETSGGLTCCHIFKTPTNLRIFEKLKRQEQNKPSKGNSIKPNVYQPNRNQQHHRFGRVMELIDLCTSDEGITVDAALIEIEERHPKSWRMPSDETYEPESIRKSKVFEEICKLVDKLMKCSEVELGNTVSSIKVLLAKNPKLFDSGDIVESFAMIPLNCYVVKYGAETKLTIGKVVVSCVSACDIERKDKRNTDKLYKQIEIRSVDDQPFSAKGDSGALVFAFISTGITSGYALKALGLLVGGTKVNKKKKAESSGLSTYITPIWAVLSMFDFPMPLEIRSFDVRWGRTKPNVHRIEQLETDVAEMKSSIETIHSNLEETAKSKDLHELKDWLEKKFQ